MNQATPIDRVQVLLEKAQLLREASQEIAARLDPDFNIFSLLLEPTDEVKLHSRFIAELLDPSGTHCKKERFLRLFLHHCLPSAESRFELAGLSVRREKDRVDIRVRNNKRQAVVIENKIHADDQPNQLARYEKKLLREGCKATDIWIVYLTLNGEEPSEHSVMRPDGSKLEPICASYRDDIVHWVDACIEAMACNPTVRETLVQYWRLVKSLLGEPMNLKYVDQLKNLLRDEQALATCADMREPLMEVHIEIHNRFWQMLDGDSGRLVAACRESFPEAKLLGDFGKRKNYDEKSVKRFHEPQQGGRNLGLSVGLMELSPSAWLAFRIESEETVFYGFTVLEEKRPHANQDHHYREWLQVASSILPDRYHKGAWLACRTPEPVLNFSAFNEHCRALLNEMTLKDMVDRLTGDIASEVGEFKQRMSDDSY